MAEEYDLGDLTLLLLNPRRGKYVDTVQGVTLLAVLLDTLPQSFR